MKRLVVCFDGTWNNPDQEDNGIPAPTNVYKFKNAVRSGICEDGCEQLVYYHPGVGGEERGLVEKVAGGAIGAGIRRHIRSAYHWLACHYEEGDDVYLVGFSRGAFTARSIGGMLGGGLLDLTGVSTKDGWIRVNKVFDVYRGEDKPSEWSDGQWRFFNSGNALPIRFVGVWDTVGALGIPDDFEILNLFDDRENWRFHNTKLGDNVKTARHAMALDEMRSSFTVTRWANAARHPDAVELWFPGCHSDVGGGYAECDLSDGALEWMIDEAAKCGLDFFGGVRTQLNPNPIGIAHNSFKGMFAKLRSRPRCIDAMVPQNAALFHSSAVKRQATPPISQGPYFPTLVLAKGSSAKATVYADTRWNWTGLFLSPGEYCFSAVGEWKDSKDTCTWKGTQDGKLTRGDVVRSASSFLGSFEKVFKKFTNNKSTDFYGTKRVEEFPWFTLVGAVANDGGAMNVANDGSPEPHQYIHLYEHRSKSMAVKIKKGGYMYAFANDVWTMYKNNRGSVELTVRRVS